jgi:hypothetical protein
VTATLLGPVVAVQVQKFIERARAEHERRDRIFKILMATRATKLALDHIQALNMIAIEFRGRKFVKVRSAWRAYFSHLCEEPPEDPQAKAVYFGKRPDLFVDVLQEMATALGYKEFDKTQILKEAYVTRFQEEVEADQNILRKKLVEVLTGKAAIPMSVVYFPSDADVVAHQAEYFKHAVEQIKAGKPVRVEIIGNDSSLPKV